MPAEGKHGAKTAETAPAQVAAKKTATGSAKKVTIRKSVADRISLFNTSGELKGELRLSVVALSLSKLDEQAALEVLDNLLESSDNVEDPNAFVCKRARQVATEQRLAAEQAAQAEGEEGAEEDAEPDAQDGEKGAVDASEEAGTENVADEPPEVIAKRHVKLLNRSDVLWDTIKFSRIQALVPLVGAQEFLQILQRLETNAEEVSNPTAWIRKEAIKKLGKAMAQADKLNWSIPGKMDLLAPLDLVQVREPLTSLPESTALQILKELEDKVFEIKDPTSWVIAEAKKKAPTGPVAEQLRQLDASGRLAEPIRFAWALEALTALPERKALDILRNLSKRAANIRNPTGWINAEVRMRLQPAMAGPAAAAAPPSSSAKRPLTEKQQAGEADKRLRAAVEAAAIAAAGGAGHTRAEGAGGPAAAATGAQTGEEVETAKEGAAEEEEEEGEGKLGGALREDEDGEDLDAIC
mmetsp:Transcript_67310/g.186508  ORF Transcript_67310/g.186508 Transcript_67310/m.186508 type:complete len:468 (-) Transcript_67310:49-1452(-)